MPELFITGFILGNTICAFSSCAMSPILYISASGSDTKSALKALCIFSSARVAVYILLGACAGISGRWISKLFDSIAFHTAMGIITGIIIILSGILIISEKKLPGPACRLIKSTHLKKSGINMAMMGALLALVPCAPLTGLLSQAFADAGGVVYGALGGLLFGLGTTASIPLWLFGLLTGFAPLRILTHPTYYRNFRYICSFLLVVIGMKYIIYVL
ncbi:MAG TPA: sulfite exporter TauE/SafE family protein [Clostridia bacterium]|nr:sulfite exporter TauE/SafE family protein [Clostridia bacterium]